MAINEYTGATNIIASLPDDPNDSGGLTAAQLKAKFDENAANLKTYINDTLVAELNSNTSGVSGADNVGYGGDVPDVSTVGGALNKIWEGGSGTIPPDDSITTAKLVDENVTTAKLADAAVTLEKAAADLIAAIAAKTVLVPIETITASWSESLAGETSVIKTISHTLGKIPSQVKIFFKNDRRTACVNISYKNGVYNYEMSGDINTSTALEVSGGVWKPSYITDGYLFGVIENTYYAGCSTMGPYWLRLSPITFTDTTISFPIYNSSGDATTISSSVIVEVYA